LISSEGAVFRTQSDTEVILAAVARWGLAATLPRLRGMFAFAMWDAKRRTLSLARDPLGIKPLYYGRSQTDFVFASELKAIAAASGFRRELNREALGDFIGTSYVPAPHSVFRDIYKLRPGHVVTVNERGEWREQIFFDAIAAAPSRSHRESNGGCVG